MGLETIRNFLAIDDRLATAGQPSEAQLREVSEAGYEVVINLGLLDPRYCLPDEAGLAAALGLRYHHVPVDFKAPRLADLERFFEVMLREDASRRFVHCAANYRVSVFFSLYAQSRMGWSAEQADAHIRRLWEPDATWCRFVEDARLSSLIRGEKA